MVHIKLRGAQAAHQPQEMIESCCTWKSMGCTWKSMRNFLEFWKKWIVPFR